MVHFIRADIRRLWRRWPLRIANFLVVLSYIFMMVKEYWETSNSISFMSTFGFCLGVWAVFIVLVEFGALYADVIRAKVMQVALGYGITRKQMVLSKVLETALVLGVQFVFFGLLTVGLGAVLGANLVGEQLTTIAVTLFTGWLQLVGFLCFAMVPIFAFENTILGFFILGFLLIDGDKMLCTLVQMVKGLEQLPLENYRFTAFINALDTQLTLGRVHADTVLWLIVYFAAAVGLSMLLFSRRELEF